MVKSLVILSAVALFSTMTVCAQPNLPPKVNSSEQMFLRHAAEIDLSEVDLAQLAQQNASADAVKHFAQRMITDHTQNLQMLKDLAARVDIVLPDQLGTQQTALYGRLAKLSGTEFDHAYINAMVEGHTQAVSDFKNEVKSASDADVRNYATKTLPTIEGHLKLAHEVAVQIGATSSR